MTGAFVMLTRRADFLAAAGSGRKCATKGMVVQLRLRDDAAAPSEDPRKNVPKGVRCGLTASRRVGNAVIRNRAKRRLRALAREILPQLKSDADIVLIARAETAERDFALLRGDLHYALRRLGVTGNGAAS